MTRLARIFVIIVGSALLVNGQEKWIDFPCDYGPCSGSCQVDANSNGGYLNFLNVQNCIYSASGEHASVQR